MNEKPIIFNSEMVQAILDDRKFVTRRIIKPPFEMHANGYITKPNKDGRFNPYVCPYGKVGDRLWVRETFQESFTACLTDPKQSYNDIIYKADGKTEYNLGGGRIKWKPSIFMSRKISRINLEITDIKVERLQDISEEDAIKEGIGKRIGSSAMGHTFTGVEHFHALWDGLNKKRGFGWDKNPWCWCIKFKREI